MGFFGPVGDIGLVLCLSGTRTCVPSLGSETFFWGGRVSVFLYIFWVCGSIYQVGTAFQRGECKVRIGFVFVFLCILYTVGS